MTRQSIIHTLILSSVALSAVVGVRVHTAGFANRNSAPVVLKPGDIVWNTREDGVRVAVLHGDPNRPGPFALRLDYPAGYRKGPHTHPNDAYVTVLEGSYFRGYGDTFDPGRAVHLTPGTFSVNPAGVSHYEWTTEPALLQVQAVGPWATVYVDAKGNPSSKE